MVTWDGPFAISYKYINIAGEWYRVTPACSLTLTLTLAGPVMADARPASAGIILFSFSCNGTDTALKMTEIS